MLTSPEAGWRIGRTIRQASERVKRSTAGRASEGFRLLSTARSGTPFPALLRLPLSDREGWIERARSIPSLPLERGCSDVQDGGDFPITN